MGSDSFHRGDDFQADVESLTTEQVNTLKAIFTDDAPASGSGS